MGRDLKLEQLTKRYGNLTAVDHVNLEIKEGEFICILYRTLNIYEGMDNG